MEVVKDLSVKCDDVSKFLDTKITDNGDATKTLTNMMVSLQKDTNKILKKFFPNV